MVCWSTAVKRQLAAAIYCTIPLIQQGKRRLREYSQMCITSSSNCAHAYVNNDFEKHRKDRIRLEGWILLWGGCGLCAPASPIIINKLLFEFRPHRRICWEIDPRAFVAADSGEETVYVVAPTELWSGLPAPCSGAASISMKFGRPSGRDIGPTVTCKTTDSLCPPPFFGSYLGDPAMNMQLAQVRLHIMSGALDPIHPRFQ